MANIQDSASFGVNYILDDVRKANLSASSAYINDQQANAGLLLTASNVSDQVSGKYLLTLAETALTKSAVGDSNVDQKVISLRFVIRQRKAIMTVPAKPLPQVPMWLSDILLAVTKHCAVWPINIREMETR